MFYDRVTEEGTLKLNLKGQIGVYQIRQRGGWDSFHTKMSASAKAWRYEMWGISWSYLCREEQAVYKFARATVT